MNPSFAISDFVRSAEDLPGDITAAAGRFLAQHPTGGWTLNLGGGQPQVNPEVAPEKILFMSNNDCGLTRSPFMLRGIKDAVIDGQGAQVLVRGTPAAGRGEPFLSHSMMVPFVLEDCENVTLRNFSVDWKTPFAAQGLITAVQEGQIDIEMQAEMNWWVWNGRLYFDLEGIVMPLQRVFAVETATGASVRGMHDNCSTGWECNWMATKLDDQHVRFNGPVTHMPQPGQTLLLWLAGYSVGGRRSSAIFANRCRNLTFENITLYHAWGMGVIAQWSRDITIRRMTITARPGSGRLFSLTADGVHFASCAGQVLIEDSRFENQFDDAINSHGLYCRITQRLNDTTVRGHRIQVQQTGQEVTRPGDTVEFVRSPSLTTLGTGIVKAVRDLNTETVDIEFTEKLPDFIGPGVLFEDLDWQPDLTVRRCVMRHSRPRGILPSTRGKVVIEQCYFETPGPAILVPVCPVLGESGRVHDMVIRDNQFVDCSHAKDFGRWGDTPMAPITITREVDPAAPPTESFHRNVRIENNTFDRPNGPSVSGYSVDGLLFRGNKIIGGPEGSPVVTQDCQHVTIINDQPQNKHE